MSKLLFGGPYPFRQTKAPSLVESSNGRKAVRVEGVFQNYKVINENGRRYPLPLWQKVFSEGSDFKKRLENRAVLGMIEHPEDGVTRLDKAALVVVEARIATESDLAGDPELQDGDIIGAYETLPTPEGKILEGLLMAQVQFGVSSRGNGSVSESDDCHEVNPDDFVLETWDAVFSPSVVRALPKLRAENANPAQIKRVIENIMKTPSQTISESGNGSTSVRESSFILATGIMNCGEQLIPIQLIAESQDGGQRLTWINQLTNEALPYFTPSTSTEEAIRKFTTFCETNGHAYDLPILSQKSQKLPVAEGKPSKPSPNQPATTMSALAEMRKIKTGVIQLRQTQVAKLKPSDKVAFFEAVADYRTAIAAVTSSDASTITEGNRLLRILEEFEDTLDAETAPAPEDTPEPAPGPIDGGEGGEGDDDDSSSPEEVADILDHAAEIIDELSGDDDEEAADLADELRNISAELAPAGDDDGLAPEGGSPDNLDPLPMESVRRKLRKKLESKKRSPRKNRTERKYSLLLKRFNRLKEASEKLFKAHKDSNPLGEGRNGLAERATRFEEAAKELASRYNTDMKEMGIAVIRLQRPDIWEQYEARLTAARSFKEFTAITESLTKKHPAPAKGGNNVTESTEPKKPTKAEEGKTSSPEGGEGLIESHPSITMIKRARQNSCRYSG